MQSSQSFASRYLTMKREKMAHGWTLAKRNKGCYLFLAPYAILFFTFMILPIATSIVLSFTYYNILEPARFIGLQNYINLILQDEVQQQPMNKPNHVPDRNAMIRYNMISSCLISQRKSFLT